MARQGNTVRKGPVSSFRPPPPSERSILLQLMGFPPQEAAEARSVGVVDWLAVMARFASHPQEAAINSRHNVLTITEFDTDRQDDCYCLDKYPLFLALANEVTPVTRQAVTAFLQAYPDPVVNQPRSAVLSVAYANPRPRSGVRRGGFPL
jgi:hypothetical protein